MKRSFWIVAKPSLHAEVNQWRREDLRGAYRQLRRAGLMRGEARSLILNVLWSGELRRQSKAEQS